MINGQISGDSQPVVQKYPAEETTATSEGGSQNGTFHEAFGTSCPGNGVVIERGQRRQRPDWQFDCKAHWALSPDGQGAVVVAAWDFIPGGLSRAALLGLMAIRQRKQNKTTKRKKTNHEVCKISDRVTRAYCHRQQKGEINRVTNYRPKCRDRACKGWHTRLVGRSCVPSSWMGEAPQTQGC